MSDYWKDNAIKKPQAIVVCAACKLDTLTVCGARHFDDVMHQQIEASGIKGWARAEQGFINQFGEFLTREEALKVLLANDQSTRTPRAQLKDSTIIFSEDLY